MTTLVSLRYRDIITVKTVTLYKLIFIFFMKYLEIKWVWVGKWVGVGMWVGVCLCVCVCVRTRQVTSYLFIVSGNMNNMFCPAF